MNKSKSKSKSQQLNSQQRLAAITIVLLAGIVLTSMMTAPSTSYPSLNRNREIAYTEIVPVQYDEKKLRAAKKDVANVDYGTCVVLPAITPKHDITPTFTASYPGSGAKMTWLLIEAITGFSTGDDFNINGVHNMVSIKTHYPSHEGREVPGAENVPRAMLLLRHPLAAFPSYYNYLYEMENKLENHSTRAPLKAWIAWRNANFHKELQVWRKHCEYWMDRYSPINRLVISYEKMTDDVMGAVEATRIAEFLSRSEGVTTCPPEMIPCIWHKVVKYKEEQSSPSPKKGGEGGNNGKENQKGQGRRLQEKNTAVAAAAPAKNKQPPRTKQEQKNLGVYPSQFKQSDPTRPNSQRSGPKYVPPYTEQQLKDLMSTLTAMLERYREEKSLAPILVQYIDTVEKRAAKLRNDKKKVERHLVGEVGQ